MRHLKQKFNSDFGGRWDLDRTDSWLFVWWVFQDKQMFSHLCRKTLIFSEVSRCQKVIAEKPDPSFQVVYKKHVLTLEDLSTLADQNWLNDQVTAEQFSFFVSFMYFLTEFNRFEWFFCVEGHEHVWRVDYGIFSSQGNVITYSIKSDITNKYKDVYIFGNIFFSLLLLWFIFWYIYSHFEAAA